jgi:stage IV sporulation protein FB
MKYIRFFERLLSAVFLLFIVYGFDAPFLATLTLISALIHECGHLIAIGFTKKEKISPPTPVLSGLRIKRASLLPYKSEILISLGGPLINILVFLFFLIPFPLAASEYLSYFGLVNLMTAISNLLPIEGYDGYKILSALLHTSKKDEYAEGILFFLSLFFSASLTFLSLYFIMRFSEGFWIFAIFFASLLSIVKKASIFEDS